MAKPTDYTITITNGVPNPFSLPVSVANKDTITFVDGGGGPWYIVFQNPFKDHVISTANAAKLKLYASASLGNCFYSIYAQNPSIMRSRPKPFDILTPSGGGIIIDN